MLFLTLASTASACAPGVADGSVTFFCGLPATVAVETRGWCDEEVGIAILTCPAVTPFVLLLVM